MSVLLAKIHPNKEQFQSYLALYSTCIGTAAENDQASKVSSMRPLRRSKTMLLFDFN